MLVMIPASSVFLTGQLKKKDVSPGTGNGQIKPVKDAFYCVNTSYPMDNCFTGRHDWSRQTPEKDVLYILPAGPVTECAFVRWRIVLPV